MTIRINRHVEIAESEIELAYLRSSGPGGQNVNKVETAVELRWSIASRSIDERTRANLVALAGRRLTKDGVLVIQAQRFRSQERNRADAIERLVALVHEAAKPPPPKRRPTRPTRGSNERRLATKQNRSETKATRGRRTGDHDQ